MTDGVGGVSPIHNRYLCTSKNCHQIVTEATGIFQMLLVLAGYCVGTKASDTYVAMTFPFNGAM